MRCTAEKRKPSMRAVTTVVVALVGGVVICGLVGVFAGDLRSIFVSRNLRLDLVAIAIIGGVVVALFTLLSESRWKRANEAWRQSEILLGTATRYLQRAYSVWTGGQAQTVPPNERIRWMMAARLLLAAQSIGQRISDPTHRRAYADEELYHRFLFSEVFRVHDEEFTAVYFAEDPSHYGHWPVTARAPLAEKSIAVFYRFSRWPDDAEDLLGNVPEFSGEERRGFAFWLKGLGEHIAGFRAERERIREKHRKDGE